LPCGTSRRLAGLGSAAEADQQAEGEEIFAAGAKIFWLRQAIGRVALPGDGKTLVRKSFVG